MKFSKVILIISYLVVLTMAFFFHSKWKSSNTEATLSWDVSGYYLYLPAIFIYKDIDQVAFLPEIIEKYHPTPNIQQGFTHEKSGKFVMKYSSGQAIMMLPFFTIGHIIAKNDNRYEADGFSYPYQMSVGIGMLVYAFLGMYFLYLLLTKQFSDRIAGWVFFAVVMGSNYLLFASVDQCLTHSTLFFLYALLMYVSSKFYEQITFQKAVIIGLICGLMTLIRPSEIISILIPLFWGIGNLGGLKKRFEVIMQYKASMLLAMTAFSMILFVQPFYWKYVTNDWIVYSYQDQEFSWLKPHFKDYTFSFSSGWLMYTPMMILSFVGLPWAFKKLDNIILPLFFLLAYYIVCAWDVWDYGGVAGRAMVQYYPVLAFSIGALFEASKRSKSAIVTLVTLGTLFAYLNIWWVYHCYRGEVPAMGHSKHFYYAKIGRWTLQEDDLKLMDNKFLFKGQKKDPKILEANVLLQQIKADSLPLVVNASIGYTPELHIVNSNQTKTWIRIHADIAMPSKEWNSHAQHLLVYKYYLAGNVITHGMLRPQRFLNDGERKMLSVDSKVPDSWDKLAIFFWNPGSQKEMLVQSVMVETFD